MKLAELPKAASASFRHSYRKQRAAVKTATSIIPGRKFKVEEGKEKKPRDGVNERETFLHPDPTGAFAFTMHSPPREFTAPDRESSW